MAALARVAIGFIVLCLGYMRGQVDGLYAWKLLLFSLEEILTFLLPSTNI